MPSTTFSDGSPPMDEPVDESDLFNLRWDQHLDDLDLSEAREVERRLEAGWDRDRERFQARERLL